MKVIVDTLGADHSPVAEVEGALLALRENRELKVVLTGDEILGILLCNNRSV